MNRFCRNGIAGVWFTFFTLLAAWNFYGTSSPSVTKHVAVRPIIAANAAPPPTLFQVAAEPKPRFAAKPIRDIQPIADRVVAHNPKEQLDDLPETHLADLSESELAKLETELAELLDNEPLPALIDGIPDDAELLVSNVNEEEDDSIDAEPTKSEKLYDELLAAAEALASQSSPLSPELTDYGPFVREHWRVIHFLLTRPDGDLVRICLARPTWWVEKEQIKVGGQYEFDMEEVGAVGLADVLSIKSCPEPTRRQNEHHRLVTGKFEHEASNVIDLYVEGQGEPIGTTANHPFWSEYRQAFVEAASLRPGESLLNAEGERVRVITHSPRPGPQTVYNLEVNGEHVYQVTGFGILVHNSCSSALGHLGEWMARRALTRLGGRVLGAIQNGSGHGIDLVVRFGRRYFVVEVKASFLRWRGAQSRGNLVKRTLDSIGASPGTMAAGQWVNASTRAKRIAALINGRGARGFLIQINLSAGPGRWLRFRPWR